MSAEREQLDRLVIQASALANALANAPACLDVQWHGLSCLRRERNRKWRTLLHTPTQHQRPKQMCDACAASWYAIMSEASLRAVAKGLPDDHHSDHH